MAHHNTDHEDESFFVSMTDIMVGLLFIFILIIMYFAVQAKIDAASIVELDLQNEEYVELIAELGAGQLEELTSYQRRIGFQRSLILNWISEFLRDEEGVEGVQIIDEQGVLRLPEGLLFNSGEFRFEDDSRAFEVSQSIARALSQILPCSVLNSEGMPYLERGICELSRHNNSARGFIQAIYVEGHTDNDDVRKGGLSGDPNLTDNLKLSARRSTNTFTAIVDGSPQILEFFGPVIDGSALRFEPVLASSAYGEWRPAVSNETEAGKRSNRRIDLRIVMYVPPNIQAMQNFLTSIGEEVVRDGS